MPAQISEQTKAYALSPDTDTPPNSELEIRANSTPGNEIAIDISSHALPLVQEDAAAELISILSTKGLQGTASALTTLAQANKMVDDPKAIRKALALQVPVLQALMNRLILSAHGSKPENGIKYIAASLATHAALVKVLSALYETRQVESNA